MSDLKSIRNIGEKMSAMLISVGIKTREDLEEIGAREAQYRLLCAGKANHHFYYQALRMGLMDRMWNDLDGDEKASIKSEFRALQMRAKADFIADNDDTDLPPLIARAVKEFGVL